MGAVAFAVAGALIVVAVIVTVFAVRAARHVPPLETLVGPDDATLRLDRSRRVVAVDDRAHALLGWTQSDLDEAGAFDRRVLNDDARAGVRDVTAAGDTNVPVVYREIAVPRGVVVVLRDRRPEVALEARAAAGERDAADASRRRDEADALAAKLQAAVERLEHQLTLESTPPGLAEALWRLELVRQHRGGWTRSPVPGGAELGSPGERLSAALASEVEVVREDVGTYVEIDEPSFETDLDAAFALGTLRMAQEILAAVAKRCDAIAVTVRTEAASVGLTVSCSGWSAEPEATHALEVIATAAADLAGDLTVTEVDGSLVADVTLPRPVS